MIRVSVSINDLLSLLERQFSSFFPLSEAESVMIDQQLSGVLGRMETCLSSRINGYMEASRGGIF